MGVYILILAKSLTQIKIWRNAKVLWEWPLIVVCFCWLLYLLPCLFLNFLIATAFMCTETAVPESWFVYLLNFVYMERFVAIGEKSNLWEWPLEMISVIWSFSLSRHLCGHFKTKVYLKVLLWKNHRLKLVRKWFHPFLSKIWESSK